MRRLSLLLICLLFPILAWALSGPDLIAQAQAKKAHGDFKGAIDLYNQAIAQNPKNVAAYLGRATVLALEGDWSEARDDDNKAIELDPKNPIAWGNRGNVSVDQGMLSDALTDYTQAIKLDPHHIHAFINRGNVKNLQKKYAAAIEDYSAAIALDPKNAAAYYNRGGAKRSLDDYAGAKADFSKAIELNPVDVPAYINRAILEMAQKDWAAATADLDKCTSLVPDERQAYIRAYQWVIAAKQGDPVKATRNLTDITKDIAKPLSETWGWEIARFLAGQVDERTFLASAISFETKKNKGQKAQALYFAGLKRTLSGDKVGAGKFFQQSITLSNPTLHEYILAKSELKTSAGAQ